MEGISANQIMDAVVVILALLSAVTVIDKAVDIFKKWRAPSNDVASKLAVDKARLDRHEAAIHGLQGSDQVMCAGILALLDHELHNGNSAQMEKARDDIMAHLHGRLAG